MRSLRLQSAFSTDLGVHSSGGISRTGMSKKAYDQCTAIQLDTYCELLKGDDGANYFSVGFFVLHLFNLSDITFSYPCSVGR